MEKISQTIHLEAEIPEDFTGQRLDQVLASLFPDYSRSRLQSWVKDGHVSLNGKPCRNKDKVFGGEQIVIHTELSQETRWQAQENRDLNIIYEDDDIIIVNKPINLVVHPGAGNPDNTLVNALLHHAPELAQLPRAGIIHRIDKDTSGLLVIAKSLPAHTALIEQLQSREMGREYYAIVCGHMIAGGTVDAPIGRHPKQRKKMAINDIHGKEAISHYRVVERFREHTLVKVKLETGRTHQIRVHMAHVKYPLVGDQTYGQRLRIPSGASEQLQTALRNFKHQALHAKTLVLNHPITDKTLSFSAPIPEDMENLIYLLRKDQKYHEDH